ncbi:hypothetical protein [Paenibacillus polymyxa]|uniref:hypothetical protein n=1 Tax=Paenibacillus polymyxa TaxID=1406 RepID=UPI002AB47B6D|nr:hypothetical protein [Paenibacillus polymyxa]MDY8026191.1 hypothetical protein [Paenibacillus polymyxa]
MSALAGCANQGTADSSPKEKIPATLESVETNQATILHSLDEIKWDEVKDPLIEDSMITKLKAAIAPFVSKDLDQFHAVLSPTVKTGHDYLLDQPVKFTGIEKAERIKIPVVGDLLEEKEGFSLDILYYFYLIQDKDGAWQIVSID